jgi:tetratricopeptide (TPR) repeat protein
MIGKTISHYRIVEQLGAGGVGTVYRAADLRLGRDVAIKVLAPDLAGEPAALENFKREARLSSALNHPHICTIHDVGRPLPTPRFIELAFDIASALDAAHQRGIIHRDLKPTNIFVGSDGRHAKVLDFGLARLLQDDPRDRVSASAATLSARPEASTTRSGSGTSAYMSPEQARGERLDPRTDLFSFGAVLYEMATGQRAFAGETAAVVYDGILNRAPSAPTTLNPALPADIEALIGKALEKNRELRYQTAADALADLRRIERRLTQPSTASGPITVVSGGSWSEPVGVRPPPKRRRVRAVALGLLALAAAAGVLRLSIPEARPLTERDAILLADFVNTTGDAVFDDTLREALAVQLDQSPFLDIVSRERVSETLQLMTRARDERLTHDLAREVCQREGVKAMIEGSIASLGGGYVVTVEATECRSGESLAREQIQVDGKERVLQGLGRIASSLRGQLGESLATVRRFGVPIEQATTPSLEALKAYALGVSQRAAGKDVEAIPFFKRAVELDPGFPSAHSALSSVYGSLGEEDERLEHARLAYAGREHVSERERLYIEYQLHDATGDELGAVEDLELWKQLYPRDFRPANALAVSLNRLGAYERASEEAREAQRRNPSHPFPYSNLAYALRGANRFADSRETAEQAVARGIETLPTRRLLYQLALLEGDAAAAERHLAWGRGRQREFDLIGAQAQAVAFGGQLHRARELYRRTADMAERQGLLHVGLGYAAHAAWTEALFGDRQQALLQGREILRRDPTPAPALRVAATLALAGAPEEAERVIARLTASGSSDAFVKRVYVPIAEAAVHLARRQPARAAAALGPAAPYELGGVAALAPVYLRGLAYLQQRNGTAAARQFETILDHRGVDPFSPLYALAGFEQARALALAGDVARSRAAYDAFLAAWVDADPELPVLRAARAERARLR